MNRTDIGWTDWTWGVVTGCSHISEGCRNCYAELISLRAGWSQLPWTAANASVNVKLHSERLDQCVARGIPVFFKQSAGLRDGAHPYLIEADGSKTEWRQFPRVDRAGQGELFLETPAEPS